MTPPKHGTGPIDIVETPGKKSYCTCGWSEKLPYCDGSHKRLETGCHPVKLELSEAEAGPRPVCQCHRTKTPPWCDGSHETCEKVEK